MPTYIDVIGTQQSPVNIETANTIYSVNDKDQLDITYSDVKEIEGDFSDHNFVIAPSKQPILIFRGNRYRLVKIHFHRACEHMIDGVAPSHFELHLLHQKEICPGNSSSPAKLSTEKLVVAAFFEICSEKKKSQSHTAFHKLNKLLREAKLTSEKSVGNRSAAVTCAQIPLKDFVPLDRGEWFCYEGSLTSPAYTEDVTWILLRTPEAVPAKDVNELIANHADQEQRPLQPLNRRIVLRNFDSLKSDSCDPHNPVSVT